jgi:hypothetical protein
VSGFTYSYFLICSLVLLCRNLFHKQQELRVEVS